MEKLAIEIENIIRSKLVITNEPGVKYACEEISKNYISIKEAMNFASYCTTIRLDHYGSLENGKWYYVVDKELFETIEEVYEYWKNNNKKWINKQ